MALPLQCPCCHSANLWQMGCIVKDRNRIEFHYFCRKCDHEWQELFKVGEHIATTVIAKGNKSRKWRCKFDATRCTDVPPEVDALYQTLRQKLGLTKYRKKPVVVEAVRWDGNNVSEVSAFIGMDVNARFVGDTVVIPTLEGDMTASNGDWIIRGVNGEYYPCKPDVFTKTYEPVVE